jgi:hypothetical protein
MANIHQRTDTSMTVTTTMTTQPDAHAASDIDEPATKKRGRPPKKAHEQAYPATPK